MAGRLIFFEGAYDTLDLFTEELRREFLFMGYECFVYDMRREEECLPELAVFLINPVDAAIGYNNQGFCMELAEGHIIWDDLNILFINILMDHPFHYHSAMLRAPRRSVVLCPDWNHVKYIRRFYPNIWKTDFLPHGGVEYLRNARPTKINDRSIDVLYAGALPRLTAERLVPDFGKFTKFSAEGLMNAALKELLENPYKTTEQVIEEYFVRLDLKISAQELREYIADFRFIDSYAVSYYREQAVKVLAVNGIKVHIYGRGWEVCDWISNENVTLCGLVEAGEIPGIMQDSKIVLNTMTWFKNGTHDRVFNAMLAGSVALTDGSGYMYENFKNGQELLMFDLQQEWSLPEMVQKLLSDEEKMQQIADKGYLRAKGAHTFLQQAEYLRDNYILSAEQ